MQPVHSLLLAKEPHWFDPRPFCTRTLPKAVRSWLAEAGSLTQRLEAAFGPVRVRVLGEGRGSALVSESRRLGCPRLLWLWRREVLLEREGQPLLLARTVAPPATLQGPGASFARLGNRPLGALLFSHPAVARRYCEWACLAPVHWRTHVWGVPPWGRRTLYCIAGGPLLVSEFFLPEVFR